MLTVLWAKLAPYLIGAAAVVLVAFGLYNKGRLAALKAEEKKRLQAVARAVKVRHNVENRNASSGSDASERLRNDWTRD